MKTFLAVLYAALAAVGALLYKVCIPVMFVLIACKIWVDTYTWSWVLSIIVPLGAGALGFILCLIAKVGIDNI